MLELRLLTEGDADEFWHFRLSGLQESPNAFAESVEELQAMSPTSTANRFRASTPNNFVLGAFEDGRLVGTAGFFRYQGLKIAHKGRVWGVYVHPGHRGRGVARALVTDLLARVRRITDLRQVSLTVATTQLTATALYESIGFKRFGLESRSLLIGDVFVDEEHRVFMLDASSAPQ